MNRRSVWFAAAWAALAPAPLVLSGLLGRERTWGSELAFGATLILAACVLPWLWAARPDPAEETPFRERLRARAAELVLLLAGSLPALVLAFAFSEATPAAAARAVVYLLALLALTGLAIAFRSGVARPHQLAALLLWTLALPFGVLVWSDTVQRTTEHLSWVAPPLAVQALLDGEPLGGPLLMLGALALLGGLFHRDLRLSRLLRERLTGPAAASATGLLLLLGAGVALADPEVRPLLGPHVRSGDPYPLRLRGPVAVEVGARSFGHHFVAPAGAQQLVTVPLGGGHHVEVVQRDGPDAPWRPTAVELPEPRLLRAQDLLVATLGADAQPLASALVGERRGARIELTAADLPLLARAGEAVDVLVAGRGAARDRTAAAALRAWSAAGGVLVCAHRTDLLAVVAPASRPDLASPLVAAADRDLELRRLGAGLVAGPGEGVTAVIRPGLADDVDPWLSARSQRRLQRLALRNAATLAPTPLPSPRSERLAALAALAGALVLVLLALGLAPRLEPGTFLGGAALVAVALALLLRAVAAPATPVYAVSSSVLELAAGARVAGRQQFLSVAAPRPLTAELTLRGYAPPTPVFDSGLQAVQAQAELTQPASGAAPRIRLPLRPHPRTYQRLDALLLDGPLSVRFDPAARRVTLNNATGIPLTHAWALTRAGLYDLPDLPATGELTIDLTQPPVPFARWRMSAETVDEAYRRRLVTAAVTGRDLDRTLVIVGWGNPTPTIAAGVAEERAFPALIVLSAPQGR